MRRGVTPSAVGSGHSLIPCHSLVPLGQRKPAGQSVHSGAFWISENCPAAQAAQVWSAACRRLPALQAEQEALALPAVRPAVQAVQAVASGTSVKVSSRQTWQSRWPSRGLARPGMHGRQDAEVLSGWRKPAGMDPMVKESPRGPSMSAARAAELRGHSPHASASRSSCRLLL